MFPIFLKIGPITIYYYGIFVSLGVLLGYFICLREARRQGINTAAFFNVIFWTIVFSFIGAKFIYILINFREFIRQPLTMIRTGFVFYGGIIFGLVALYLLTKKYSLNFRKIADILSLGIPLSHALGRFGCFSYGCCYGKPTDSFIGMLFPPDSPAGSLGVKVIHAQLIEAFFLILIFLILMNLKKNKRFEGQLFLYYLFLYCILRFIIEFFRGDERGGMFFLSVSQFISIFVIILGVILWQRWKGPKAAL